MLAFYFSNSLHYFIKSISLLILWTHTACSWVRRGGSCAIPSLEMISNLGLLIKAAALRTSFTKRLMLPTIASSPYSLPAILIPQTFYSFDGMNWPLTIPFIKEMVFYFLSRKKLKSFAKLWTVNDAKDLQKWTEEEITDVSLWWK